MFVQHNTINATKQYFSNKLKEHFSESEIRFMYQMLVEDRLGFSRTEMLLKGQERLSESDLLYFRSVANQLLEGVPFQHIIGFTYFYDLKIKCDKRALVPRPETEELVDWMLKEEQKVGRILDICTGTGCIALAAKSVLKDAVTSGWDVSAEALLLANENANNLNLAVDFKEVDFLKVEPSSEKWDVIFSNPPYIPIKEKEEMDKTVTDFDPDLALFVPDNEPLLFYVKLAEFAEKQLNTGGSLYLEIHENYGSETMALFDSKLFKIELRQDMQGKDRMIRAQLV